MATSVQSTIELASPWVPSVDCHEANWYVAYTCANHEKKVEQQLHLRGVDTFLPLYQSVRRWKDRRVCLELPLFPGYVFVRIALRERLRVLEIPSVAHLVGFNGQPASLPSEEIEALRRGLTDNLSPKPHPYLSAGRRVRVKSGPLAGLQGVIVRAKSCYRIVLSLDLLQRSVIANLDVADVEPLN
jgi:transcription antitermination factor NusG